MRSRIESPDIGNGQALAKLSLASALRQGRDAIANAKVRLMMGLSRERVLEVKAIRLELRVVNQAQQIA
jgi:hypothetical protein